MEDFHHLVLLLVSTLIYIYISFTHQLPTFVDALGQDLLDNNIRLATFSLKQCNIIKNYFKKMFWTDFNYPWLL